MKRLLHAVGPYVPATLVVVATVLFWVWFDREIRNWFEGRPVLLGAPSAPITVDAGPLRVGIVVRPGTPLAGENELFFGVGDALGSLVEDATVTVRVGDGEPAVATSRGDGQHGLVVDLPAEPAHVHVTVSHPTLGGGEAALVLSPGRPGVGLPGSEAEGVAYFTCPMHTSIRSSGQMPCPLCGMDLVAVTHEELRTGIVRIDDRRRQLIGVRTAKVERRPLRLAVSATAVVDVPEPMLREVTSRVPGWIDELHATQVGQVVRKGDPLARIVSLELKAAEAEYLAARKGADRERGTAVEHASDELASAAGERLSSLKAGHAGLGRLEKAGRARGVTTLVAPISGVVLAKDAVEGGPVMMDRPLFRIGSLDPVWVVARVYEQDAAAVQSGMTATVTSPLRPGPASGVVSFVAPTLDAETRTLSVRVEVANPDGSLRPGSYARVELARETEPVLTVPTEAIILAGTRRIVMVDRGGGRFQPVTVRVGRRDANGTEVVEGLAPDDAVVTSGNFLLGAESRIRSAESSWSGE